MNYCLALFVLLLSLYAAPTFAAEATDATKTTVTVAGSGLESACAGTPAYFTITARDESGAARTSGGDNFIVELEGTRSISGSVLDNLDGTYKVTYTATKSGNYDTAVKLATSGGLSAAYYENVWFFYTPSKVTVDPQINMDWGTGLLTATGSDFISVRWTGKLKTQFAEEYTFFATTDDGAKLWVDNVPLIDRWDSFCNETSATIALKANVFYTLKMEYKEVTGTAYARLSWASQSTPKEIIPSAQLYYETHIKQSPFSVVVAPHVACGPRSTASGTGLAIATAGTAAQLTLQANDAYDNARGVGNDLFSVRIYPPASAANQQPAHATVVDNSDSTYSVEYTAYTAGMNTLVATLMTPSGVLATYYSSEFGTPVAVTSTTDTDWRAVTISGKNAAPDVGATYPFTARWVGFIKPTKDDVFTFRTTIISGERTRLWIDNLQLYTDWTGAALNPTGTIQLRSNFYYDVKVEFLSQSPGIASSLTFEWRDSLAGSFSTISTSQLFAGYDVMSSPFSVDVKPASTCAARTTATDGYGSLTIATAGMQSQFTITARDLYGNDRKIGGESFRVRLTGADSNAGLVHDESDGTYTVYYTATKSGSYDVAIVFGASGIASSPYRLLVKPAKRHIPSSVPNGMGLTLATAGIQSTVTVTIRDAFDNDQPAMDWGTDTTSANLRFSLATGEAVDSPAPNCNAPDFDCPNLILALLKMKYTAFTAGTFSLRLQSSTLHDGAVKGSPFALTVFPHLPCATKSTAYGAALTLVTAGIASMYTIQSRDQFGNLRGIHVGDRFVSHVRQFPVAISNAVTNRDKIATVTDRLDSTYNMAFTATRATTNSLWASLAGQGGLMSTYYSTIGGAPNSIFFDSSSTLSWSKSGGSTDQTPNSVFNSFGPFAIRWGGFVRPSVAATVTFSVEKKVNVERVNLYVDNILLVGISGATLTATATVTLPTANNYYDMLVEYFVESAQSAGSDRGLTVQWKSSAFTPANTYAAIAGTYLFASYHISNSPFSMVVKPAIACVTTSLISRQAISLATAGTTASFSVVSRDAFGNTREIAGDDWDFALLSGSLLPTNLATALDEPSINDGGSLAYQATSQYISNGAYVTSYTPTLQGVYELRGKLRQAGGLYGVYFENYDLTDNGQAVGTSLNSNLNPFRRLDSTIDFQWGTGVPVTSSETALKKIGPDFFSARWYGMIQPEFSETYTFSVEADDGVKLWVDNLLITDQWPIVQSAGVATSTQTTSRCSIIDGTIALMKDAFYNIKLEYKEIMGNATVRLYWSSRSRSRQIVPSSRLFVETTSRSLSRAGKSLTVYPAIACASQSSAAGGGLTIATTGVTSSFVISSRDAYGNERRLGDLPAFHVRVVPVIEGQNSPVVPDAVTRLAGSVYNGGLSATYYFNSDNNKFVTCQSETWTTEPSENKACALGPWSVDYVSPSYFPQFSFASSNLPGFLSPFTTTNGYRVRWKGFIKPSVATAYTFQISLPAGNTGSVYFFGAATTPLTVTGGSITASISFPTADSLYDIQIDYSTTSISQDMSFSLTYLLGGGTYKIVPTDRLYPLAGRYRVDYTPTCRGDYSVHIGLAQPGGLDATYYDDEALSSARRSRIDSTVDLNIATEADFSTGARTTRDVALSDVQSYSVRWAGLISPWTTASTVTTYTFCVVLPNAATFHGERVKLWVNNRLIIDVWDTYTDVSATQYSAAAGIYNSQTQLLYTEVKLEYKQYGATSGAVKLLWDATTPGTCSAVIPSTNLFVMRHIAGSPFPPRIILSSQTCAAASTARGYALSAATAGVQGTFLVESHDTFGNERGIGGDLYLVRLWPVSGQCNSCPSSVVGSVVDNSDSSYIASYNATKIGTYTVTTSLALAGGLSGTYYSDNALTAISGHPGGNAVAMSGPSFTGNVGARFSGFVRPSVAGVYTFTLAFNTGSISNERVKLSIEGTQIYSDASAPAATSVTAAYNFPTANSYYAISLDYHNTGGFSSTIFSLTWRQSSVMASSVAVATDRMFTRSDVNPTTTFTLTVYPEFTDASASIASGDGLSICTAGTFAFFTITSKDSFANERGQEGSGATGDSYFVRLNMDDTALVNMGVTHISSTPGRFAAYFVATVAGSYNLAVARPSPGGLTGQYFNNMWLLGEPADTNIDGVVDFSWGTGAVTPRTNPSDIVTGTDYISVRWSGFFKPSLNETYTFYTEADDGVRLWIDGTLLVDLWSTTVGNASGTINATANKMYDIKMEYKEVTSAAYARLLYSSQSIVKQVVPSSRLFNSAQHIFGSPFHLYVNPSATCAVTSVLTGQALSYATAGLSAMFTIAAKDQYANPKTVWDTTTDFFAVRATPNAAVGSYTASLLSAIKRATVTNNVVKGSYSVAYTPTMAAASRVYATLAMQGGLTATYYKLTGAAPAFDTPVNTKQEAINYDLGSIDTTLCPTCATYYCSRWEGFYRPSVAATTQDFTFEVTDATERVRLWIDGLLLMDGWATMTGSSITGQISFPIANALYDIKVEYFESGAGTAQNKAVFKVNTVAVPTDRLFAIGPHVAASPYPVNVKPHITSHQKSIIRGDALTLSTAGVASSFTITSKDPSGNNRDTGGNSYLVHGAQDPTLTANGAVFDGAVTDYTDGRYIVRYVPKEQGAYTLRVYLGSQEQAFSLYVHPGAGCASTSVSNGIALSVATAGIWSTFSIQSKDQYKNLRSVGTNTWIARLSSNFASGEVAATTASLVWSNHFTEEHNVPVTYIGQDQPLLGLGQFKASYRVTQSGNFSLAVKMLDSNGLAVTFYRDAVFGNAVLTDRHSSVGDTCCAWGTDAPNDAVGIVDGFSVRWTGFVKSNTADTYVFTTRVNGADERVRLWVDDRWVIDQWSSLAATDPTGSIGLLANTLYDLKMEYKDVSGAASIKLEWTYGGGAGEIPPLNLFSSDNHVSGSPFTVTVFPGVTCGTVSTATGTGLTLATSGIAAAFTIQARDELGNSKSSSDDLFVVRTRRGTSADIRGTVAVSGTATGQYSAFYIPLAKANNATVTAPVNAPWHDVLSSLAVPSTSVTATYYTDAAFASPNAIYSRTLDYSNTVMPTALSVTDFGIRWEGFIRPTVAGLHTFSVELAATACQSVDLWVQNVLQLSGSNIGTLIAATAPINLGVVNGLYDIRVDYRSSTCGGGFAPTMKVWWQQGATSQVIPSTRQFQRQDISVSTFAPGGLMATYYAAETLSGAEEKWTIDSTVDWSGPGGTADTRPYPLSQADRQFSVRWFGFVKPSRWDLYTFYVEITGAHNTDFVQLYVDDLTNPLIDKWAANTGSEYSATYWFKEANAYYPIEMRYKTSTDVSPHLYRLKWENQGGWLTSRGLTVADSDKVFKGVIRSDRLFQRRSSAVVNRDDRLAWFSGSPLPCASCPAGICSGFYYECRGLGRRVNDPIKVDVRPAVACSSTTSTNGASLTIATAGVTGTYRVTVRDAAANIRDSTTDALMGRAVLTSTTATATFHSTFVSSPAPSNLHDPLGYYDATYVATRSGSYQMDVSLTDGSGNGLFGSYFGSTNLTGQPVNKIDTTINFDWGQGSPTAESTVGSDLFSVRWTGYVQPKYSEVYTFYVLADDGVRLWVNGNVLIDSWNGLSSGSELQGTINLSSNVQYDVKLEYMETTGSAYVQLRFQSPSQPKIIIPASSLYPAKRTVQNGLNTLTIFENVVSATVSVVTGNSLTLATAGIAGTYTITAKDQFGNQRTNAALTEYQAYSRMIPDDAATNRISGTRKSTIAGGTANSGTHVVSYSFTRAGTHNLFTSVVIGQNPTGTLGLVATYYDESTFTSPAFSRVDSTVDWSTSNNVAPGSVADDGIFSVRWAGLAKSVVSTGYTVYATVQSADERVRVWFDNILIVDEWNTLSGLTVSGSYTRATVADQFYDITIDYKAYGGDLSGSKLKLEWRHDQSGGAQVTVPNTNLYQGYTVSGASTRLLMRPAVACATTSTLRGMGLTLSTAGTQARFTITSIDAYGNTRGIGGDILAVRAFPEGFTAGAPHNPALLAGTCSGCPAVVRGAVEDLGDCTYRASYTPTKKGAYALVSSLLVQGGLAATYWDSVATTTDAITAGVSGTPTMATVSNNVDFSFASGNKPTGLSDEAYQARWVGLVRPSKASVYTFYVGMSQANERCKLWIDNSVVVDQWTSLSATEVSGTYSFGAVNAYYDLTLAYLNTAAATSQRVTLSWKNTVSGSSSDDVSKGPIRSDRLYQRFDLSDGIHYSGTVDMYASPNVGCASRSVAYLQATSLATAGAAASFTVLGRDAYSNDRDSNADMAFQVDLYGSGGLPVLAASVTAGAQNIYTTAYTATKSKNYELFVKYNNDNAIGSPFTLTVKPNTICGGLSTASGIGLSASASGSASLLTIQARDSWSNAKTTNGEGNANGDTFVVRVVRMTAGQGTAPEKYSTTTTDRQAVTIQGIRGTLANDGLYPFSWTQDASVSFSHYLHASWAISGGIIATYYSKATPATTDVFDMNSATNRVAVRRETSINVNDDNFNFAVATLPTGDGQAVRYSGFILPTQTQTYTFQVTRSDKSATRLWVDSKLIIGSNALWTADKSGVGPGSETGTIPLVAGTFYDITLDYLHPSTLSNDNVVFQYDTSGAATFATWPSTNLFQREDVSGSPWVVTASS